MRLVQQILTHNDCYRAGRTIQPKGIMVHSTGANNPKVSRYVPGNGQLGRNTYGNHWDRSGVNTCVHAFIGKFADGKVGTVQTLPWNRRGWHCGKGRNGSANDTHISFEICEDGLTSPAYFNSVYREAVELTAMLCVEYGLDPLKDGVVICHAEGNRRGIASAHADVEHWFPKHGKSMNDFRADVARFMKDGDEMSYEQFKEYMDQYRKELADQKPSSWAKPKLEEAKRKGITEGSRPKDFATREEVALMINAVVD